MKRLPHRNPSGHHDERIERAVKLTILVFALTWGTRFDAAAAAPAAHLDSAPAIAADFLHELRPPGVANSFLRPKGLFVDRNAREVLVSDSGLDRVLVFGEDGVLHYSFTVQPYCSSPASIVVDSDGYIFLVGSTSEGRKIFCFDFDGTYLDAFVPVESNADGSVTTYAPGSLAVTSKNHLYTLDQKSGRTLYLDRKGKVQRAFSMLEGMSPDSAREVVFGALTVVRNRLYVPYSSLGHVGVFDLEGHRLATVGHLGDEAGGLNFPIAVAVTDADEVLVLDNNRFNVVCYDANGKFVQEFGGKGYRLGWFYHPSLIAIDSLQQVYVGQIFQNWIQVCQLPPLLRAHSTRILGGPLQPETSILTSIGTTSLTPSTSHPAIPGSSRRTPVTHGNSKENPR